MNEASADKNNWAAIISSCHTPSILESVKDDFDPVSPFLPALETFHMRFAQFLTLGAYTYPFIFPCILAPVDTKAMVTPQPLDLW